MQRHACNCLPTTLQPFNNRAPARKTDRLDEQMWGLVRVEPGEQGSEKVKWETKGPEKRGGQPRCTSLMTTSASPAGADDAVAASSPLSAMQSAEPGVSGDSRVCELAESPRCGPPDRKTFLMSWRVLRPWFVDSGVSYQFRASTGYDPP